MLSIESLRKIDSEASSLTEEELESVRQSFYDFGELIFEDWCEQKFGSKNPVGLLTNRSDKDTI